jgi:hypothetical protein
VKESLNIATGKVFAYYKKVAWLGAGAHEKANIGMENGAVWIL